MAAEKLSGACRLLTASNVRSFIDSIDTVLCDCDGVLYHLNNVIPGVPDTVHKLKSLYDGPMHEKAKHARIDVWERGTIKSPRAAERQTVLYVTNNSTKTRKEFVLKCTQLGYPAVEDDIIGTAYVTQCLRDRYKYKGKVYCIGGLGIEQELATVGIKAIGFGPDHTQANFKAAQDFIPDPEVKCVVVGVDEDFSYLKAAKAATYLSQKDCLFVSTNPDSGLPTPNGRIIPGAGACLAMVKVASQREPDIVCGKPNQTMFDVVMEKYKLDPRKTLMIGDRLDTDILFAGSCGLKSLLVLTGFSNLDEVKRKQQSKSPTDQKQVPNYYLPSLADLRKLLSEM